VRDWSFHARVKGGAGHSFHSPSHTLRASRDGSDLLLDAAARNVPVDRDVVLSLADGAAGGPEDELARFCSAEHEGARYLMLRYRPALAGQKVRQRRDWVILFESSGDRDPLLARTQVEVVRGLLANAEADDTVAVLAAGTRTRALAAQARPVTPANVQAAVSFLEGAHLVGALDLGRALAEAAPFLKAGTNPYLVHVGSGIAALGERRADVLAQSLPEGTHYVGVGVGRRWNRAFMKVAAERTAGYFTQINPDETMSWRAFELAATLNTPRLLDVRVEDKAGRAAFLPFARALAQGEELAAVARLGAGDKDLPQAVTVHGTLDGRPFERELAVQGVAAKADYLPRTWATLEIERLLAEDAAKHKDRVVALSKAMYVMTPYTSLLVLENEEMYQQFKVDRGRQDHWAPYPCPERIEVVAEDEDGRRIDPRRGVKPSTRQVRETVLGREPPRVLTSSEEGRNRKPLPTGGVAGVAFDLPRRGGALNQYMAIKNSRESMVLMGLNKAEAEGSLDPGLVPRPMGSALQLFNAADCVEAMHHLQRSPNAFPPLSRGYEVATGRIVQTEAQPGVIPDPTLVEKSLAVQSIRYEPQPALPRAGLLGSVRSGEAPAKAAEDHVHVVVVAGTGPEVDAVVNRLLHESGGGSLLHKRPGFSGEDKLFFDLVAYAPGLNTSAADLGAVLEAEAAPDAHNNLDGEHVDVLAGHPDEPLAQYLAVYSSPVLRKHASQWAAGSNPWGDGFLRRLALAHALCQRWQDRKNLGRTPAQRRAELERALGYVRRHRDSAFGWALLGLIQDRALEEEADRQDTRDIHRALAGAWRLFEDVPGLAYAARYEHARSLWKAGERAGAQQHFRALYDKALDNQALLRIDADFRLALLGQGQDGDGWGDLMRRTAARLVRQKQRPAVLTLARQCWEVGDQALANHLLAAALDGVDGKERVGLKLAGLAFLWETGQLAPADRLLRQLLDDPQEGKSAGLWRLAAKLAGRRDMPARQLECLERALELEYCDLPEVINLQAVRGDYEQVLEHYQSLAQALVTLRLPAPEGFRSRVVRAADRWRALDRDGSSACRLAARALQTLGERELAWDYLTTPVGQRPNEAGPWAELAQTLNRQGDLTLADRAYAAAFAAEPTNAQLLWDRAQNLGQAGRAAEARSLYRRLAEGTWQPRFNWVQTQARWQLEKR
jgi:hypothetical protein